MARKKKAPAVADIQAVSAEGSSGLVNYAEIFQAHFVTKQAVCLWGSSGYGKTSTVKEAAKTLGMKLVDMRLSYRDPLSLFLPVVDGNVIRYIFSDILDVLFNAAEPTIVFLDEITNPSSPEIYNVLKELLNERTFLGRAVSDNVLFVAASNWASEDTGVKELPDSLMRRMTHMVFAPDRIDMGSKLRPLAREWAMQGNTGALIPNPHVESLNLTPCPRQIDACELLFTQGGLRGDALRVVFVGRIGLEAGVSFAKHCMSSLSEDRQKKEGVLHKLPAVMTKDTVPLLKQAEEEGHVIEIISYLTATEHDQAVLGYYLGIHAGPEVCRAMFERGTHRGCRVSPDDYPILRQHPEYREEDSHLIIWPQVAYLRRVLEIGVRHYQDGTTSESEVVGL